MVGVWLEVWGEEGRRVVPIKGDKITVGKAPGNHVVISEDDTISRLHAVLEQYPAGWCVRDLASRNGTLLNGAPVISERVIRSGDEIKVGQTRLVFRSDDDTVRVRTASLLAAPELTRREKDVLTELCKPALAGSLFTRPASTAEIATALFVTEDAVRHHLSNLFDKFDIARGADRRVRLAAEAIRLGAVSIADRGRDDTD